MSGHEVRSACSSCEAPGLPTVLTLGTTPLADTFPLDASASEVWYPLRVQWCRRCGMVQLQDVVPDGLLYGADYGFSSGASPAKRAAHEVYARRLVDSFGERARRLTVEIACNDGDLLAWLAAAGCRVVGVDPAPRQSAAARERGLDVHTASFGLAVAKDLVASYGQAGLVVASNVLAHVADPNDFMAGVAELLSRNGSAVIQVQYVGDLVAGNEWDHVYHEHRSYFSLNSLALLAMRHGLSVRRAERVPDQGGSLRVVLSHGVGYGDEQPALSRWPEDWLRREATFEALQGRVDYCKARLLDLVDDVRSAGKSVAGLAASAKSCTLLNYCDIGADVLSWVLDTTPAKWGRVTPGSHIPIVGPADVPAAPDYYLHLAWNYLSWSLRHDRHEGGWIVPIPFPVVL